MTSRLRLVAALAAVLSLVASFGISVQAQPDLARRVFLPLILDSSNAVAPVPTKTPTTKPQPTTTPAPTNNIRILSSFTYTNDFGRRYIEGEVQNDTSSNVEYVRIDASLYDAGGTFIDTDFTYTDLDILKPGQRSPFKIIILDPPANYASYTLRTRFRTTTEEPPSGIRILSSFTYTNDFGRRYIEGEVQNDTSSNVEYVRIDASLYDAGGTFVGTDFTYSDVDILKPGQRSPFKIIILDPPANYASYTLRTRFRTTTKEPLSGLTTVNPEQSEARRP